MVPHRSRLKATKAFESIFDGRVAQLGRARNAQKLIQ